MENNGTIVGGDDVLGAVGDFLAAEPTLKPTTEQKKHNNNQSGAEHKEEISKSRNDGKENGPIKHKVHGAKEEASDDNNHASSPSKDTVSETIIMTPDGKSIKASSKGKQETVVESKVPGVNPKDDDKVAFSTSLLYLLEKSSTTSKELNSHIAQCLYAELFYKIQADSLADKKLYREKKADGTNVFTSAKRENQIVGDIKAIHPMTRKQMLLLLITEQPYKDVLAALHKDHPQLAFSRLSYEEMLPEAKWFGLISEALKQITDWSVTKKNKIKKA